MAPRHVERTDFFSSFFEKIKLHEEIKDLRASVPLKSQQISSSIFFFFKSICFQSFPKPTGSITGLLQELPTKPLKEYIYHTSLIIPYVLGTAHSISALRDKISPLRVSVRLFTIVPIDKEEQMVLNMSNRV